MSNHPVRRFTDPDEVMEIAGVVRSEIIDLGGFGFAHTVHDPGFRWSVHVAPIVGTEWCETRHIGTIVRGVLHILYKDGEEYDLVAGDVYEIAPGHDGWVVGDEPCEVIDWTGVRTWMSPLDSLNRRVLVTMVLTDIVDSTTEARRRGPTAWADLIARHDSLTSDTVERFRGRTVAHTGDGILATFDGAGRAIRCATAIQEQVNDLGLACRIGIHTGEVDRVSATEIAGVAVHETARIAALGGAGEILVSEVTRSMISDESPDLEDAGVHSLRGTEREVRLYRVQ